MRRCKIFFLLLLLFLSGCNHQKQSIETRKKILSTTAQIGDLVAEIGGDRIFCQVLIQGEMNPHSYELVKGDDEKIEGANLLFYHGLGLEHGASVVSSLKEHPRAFGVGNSIKERFPEKILFKDSLVDPHLWMDVSLWKEAVDLITEQIVLLDPEGKTEYLQRAEHLKAKMDQTHLEMKEILRVIPEEKRYLVTSHDAFHYFAKSYLANDQEQDWEKRFTAPEGLAPDGQLNPIDLKQIIDHLGRYQIEVLFPESSVNRDSIRKIASAGKQLGLKVRICTKVLYGDTFKGSYLEAMKHNALVIAQELS